MGSTKKRYQVYFGDQFITIDVSVITIGKKTEVYVESPTIGVKIEYVGE